MAIIYFFLCFISEFLKHSKVRYPMCADMRGDTDANSN